MERIGPYQVLQQLAQGGSGVVYRVRAPDGAERALKLLRGVGADERARRRLTREVQALARLEHPGVVRLRDTGQHQGTPYLVLDLLPGASLQERLRLGPLPVDEAVALTVELAQTLVHVHALGVLHRDLKPDNVLLDARGRPVLTDFGLVKDLDLERSRLSRSGAFLGTPGYSPPEQIRAQPESLGPATDVYGLGGVLYASLTGRPPHWGDSLPAVLASTLQGQVDPPSELRPEVPPELDAIVLRCLEADPQRRFPSTGALAMALETWRHEAAPPPPPPPPAPPSRLPLALGAALAGALLAGGVAFLAWPRSPAPTTAELPARPDPAPDEPPAQAQASPPTQDEPPADEPPAPSAGGIDAARLLELDALIAAGRAEEARAQAREVVARHPRDPLGHVVLGMAARHDGDLEGSRRHLQRALELDPDSQDALEHLGLTQLAGGRPEEALASFERALAGGPRPRAHVNRGNAYLAQGQASAAVEAFDAALRIQPSARAWTRRAQAQVLLGDAAQALQDADQALATDRLYPTAHTARAEALVRLGRLDEARESIRQALLLDERLAYSHLVQAMVHVTGQEWEAALAAARRSGELEPRAGVHQLAGVALRGLGRLDEAEAELDAALALEPASVPAQAVRASIRDRRGDLRGALRDYTRALERAPRHAELLRERAALLLRMGQARQAEADLLRVLELRPRDTRAWVELAQARNEQGRSPEALEAFRQALRLSPDDPEALFGVGCTLAAGGDLRGAGRAFDRLLELQPDSALALANRGDVRHRLGDPAGALADYTRALELAPRLKQVYAVRARLHRDQGRTAEALADCEQALALDPEFAPALELRAELRR